MVLLSGMMRAAAVTGRPQDIRAWVADRQAGAWAERTIRAGLPRRSPPAQPPAEPGATLRGLMSLRDRGVITDAEFERLRAREGV